MSSAPIDVSALVDHAKLSRFHFRVIGLCAAVLFFEGFDLQAVSFVAPAMAAALGLSKPMLGPIFSAGQAGLMLGSLLFGLAGDRWGRKRVFIFSNLLFGLASLATALSPNYQTLFVARLIAGLGLGGAGPLAITIASDYCPKRIRASLTMIMYCGFTIGGVGAGAVNALVVGYGWKTIFYIGGVIPLFLAPLLLWALPESLNYLISRENRGTAIARILTRLAPGRDFSASSRYVMAEAYESKFQVPELFRGGYALRTILLWSSLVICLVTLFGLSSWLPTLLTGLGLSAAQIVAISAASQAGGFLGSLTTARIIVRYPPLVVAAIGYIPAGLLLALFGTMGANMVGLLITGFLAYFCLIGTQNVVNAMAGQIYPPRVRATGVGWAIGIGRIGGTVGPMLIGLLIAGGVSSGALFALAALPLFITSISTFALSRSVGDIGARNEAEEKSEPERGGYARTSGSV